MAVPPISRHRWSRRPRWCCRNPPAEITGRPLEYYMVVIGTMALVDPPVPGLMRRWHPFEFLLEAEKERIWCKPLCRV